MSKTVLITGCSSGMGKAAALTFKNEGWNVVATMRNAQQWTQDSSNGIVALSLDVLDENSVKVAFESAVARFGGIDCVVNNAGVGLFSVFEATPMELIQDVFATNFWWTIAGDACSASTLQGKWWWPFRECRVRCGYLTRAPDDHLRCQQVGPGFIQRVGAVRIANLLLRPQSTEGKRKKSLHARLSARAWRNAP